MWAAGIRVFDGTQPTLTQVPPMTPRSIRVTVAPSSAAFSAAAIAPPPLPMTAIRGPIRCAMADLLLLFDGRGVARVLRGFGQRRHRGLAVVKRHHCFLLVEVDVHLGDAGHFGECQLHGDRTG